MKITRNSPNVQITQQVIRGTAIICSTISSAFAVLAQLENSKMGEMLKSNSIEAGPTVTTKPLPQSTFPNSWFSYPFSVSRFFADSDSGGLTVEAGKPGGLALPSWINLNEGTWKLLGSFQIQGQKVQVVNNIAFVSGSHLEIIDISNPFSPTQLGRYNFCQQAYVVDNLAYVIKSPGLHIVNVTDPTDPIFLSSLTLDGPVRDIHVANDIAYVATNGLLLVDVKDPLSPVLAGSYDTPGNGYGVYAVDKTVYFTGETNGMQILDATNPSSPSLIGNYIGNNRGVFVVDTKVYLTGVYGLQIIDVSDSSSPALIGSLTTGDFTDNIFVKDDIAYFAIYDSHVNIVNIQNPSSPTLMGSYNTFGNPSGLWAIGKRIYVFDYILGLQILERESILFCQPKEIDIGNHDIKIIAKDPDENIGSLTFTVRVEGPPTVSSSIPSLLTNVNAPFSYFIDQNVFQDPNGDIIFYSAKLANQTSLPPWLKFSQMGIFSGTPKASDKGQFSIEILALDGIVPPISATTFSLVVEHFPRVDTPIYNQAAEINHPYNFTVPDGTFIDEDEGDVLTYTTSSLPTWLSFDPLSLIFSGLPTLSDAGTQTIQLKVIDNAGASASTSFRLEIKQFPILENPLSSQLATVGQPFIYLAPRNTFSSPNGDPLSFQARRSNGDSLPNWLGFVGAKLELKGTPSRTDKGRLTLKLIAEDSKGGWAENSFHIDIVDSLSVESARVERPFTYALPDNMIPNPQGPITYNATLTDSSPLPAWFEFNTSTAILSGVPPLNKEGDYNVLITADDGVQAPAFGTVLFNVEANGQPKVANEISNQVATVGQKFRFVVPENIFIDPNNDPLTLSAIRADGRPLPDWLTLDENTLQGKPGPSHTGTFSDKTHALKICAEDGDEVACTVFDLRVQGMSNEEKYLSIVAPVFTVGVLGVGWYKKRGLFLNLYSKKYDKGKIIVPLNTPFTQSLTANKSNIVRVQAYLGKEPLFGLPIPSVKWLEWAKLDKSIAGGTLLPDWLTYDHCKSELRSKYDPRNEDSGLYTICAYGSGDVILEQFILDVKDIDKDLGKECSPLIE